MPARIQKVLLTGKTHTTLSRNYVSQGGEERLDIRLSTPNNPGLVQAFEDIQPHPTAEQLFAGAWSACYTSALDVIAKQMKVQLPNDRAVDQALAEQIAHAADEICPYSKATRGNIDVTLNVHAA